MVKRSLIAACCFSVSLNSAIEINEYLSIEGFADLATAHTQRNGDDIYQGFGTRQQLGADSDSGIAQLELSAQANYHAWSARIDVDYEHANTSDHSKTTEVEQLFASYQFAHGGSLTLGRFRSLLGFEDLEPTGLYQFSRAYDIMGLDFNVLNDYAQGINYAYQSDTTFFGLSVLDSISNQDRGSLQDTWALEIGSAYYSAHGISLFFGGAWEHNDRPNSRQADSNQWLLNTYLSAELGIWLFAAEFNYGTSRGDSLGTHQLPGFGPDLHGFNGLLMANYAYTRTTSLTGRLSYVNSKESSNPTGNLHWQATKYTLAHNWDIHDNCRLVTEFSYSRAQRESGLQADEALAAARLLLSF